MSFWGIVGIVLLAIIILSILFAMFHILFMLLPAVIVIAGLIWLINHFTKKDDDSSMDAAPGGWRNWNDESTRRPKRKKVRDAETKDVDK